MKIDSIKLNNFRNYENADINLKDGINFIVGINAQGKTNLLESVYLLSVGKSPKNSKDKQIIKFGADKSRVEINFSTREGNKTIQMLLDRFNKKSIRINNLNVLKIAELVGVLSVVYFSPDELKLIKEVPEDRRRFLDVSISQFDKAYLYDIIKYDKILKQRNTILKSNKVRMPSDKVSDIVDQETWMTIGGNLDKLYELSGVGLKDLNSSVTINTEIAKHISQHMGSSGVLKDK